MDEIYIKTTADAKKVIGQKLYWDDVSPRYIFLRDGVAEEVWKGHIRFGDGDYKRIRDLPNLRNFALGGQWKRNKDAA